ncbi:MAG: hypothetical protein ACYCPT_01915 [Acidimicrobiales bacterium]
MTELTETRLGNIERLIGKLEQNQALMLHEFTNLAKRVADHEVRLTALETQALRSKKKR